MIEYVIIFIVIYGGVWIARQSVNKRPWSKVASKLPSGRPENMLALDVSGNDVGAFRTKLVSLIPNSGYMLADGTGNPIVLEDKGSSMNLLNTMYFYPIYFSTGANGQVHLEVGIADKSSFLGSKQDRIEKLKKMFDFLTRSLK